MENWLHCNVCIKRPCDMDSSAGSYFITNCGHLFCNHCVREASPTCAVCKKPSSVTQLNDKLPEQIKTFFKPPKAMLKEAQSIINKAERVSDFQSAQQKRLQDSFTEKLKQQTALMFRMKQKIEHQKKEISEFKRFLASHGARNFSPNRLRSLSSPDRSPQGTPYSTPRKNSPSSSLHAKTTPPTFYASAPCTPSRSPTDLHRQFQQSHGRSTNSKRISLKPPPLQAKLFSSPSSEQGYHTMDGVTSKIARLDSPTFGHPSNVRSGAPTPTSTPKVPFNISQFTPPRTPSLPFSVGSRKLTPK